MEDYEFQGWLGYSADAVNGKMQWDVFELKILIYLGNIEAAPMLCAGVTVYTPLRNNGRMGKMVGIVGVGGLGHFGILFARALGAEKVVGISRKASKRDEVLALGADMYIATDGKDEKNWATENSRTIDLIISTASSPDMPLTDYHKLLWYRSDFIEVNAPNNSDLPPINAFTLISGGFKIGGSATGSPADIEEMLYFVVGKKVKP
ncbi:uncharacterized protein NECHADRAFT_81206 [Fusarium vanettenii 77-13-4]|uniref:Alcohol dehydrogenase-like C-terminal domain-containing protein n=1 Tax=Fusarium vanettenii (strain ATCC MYA-4622 / CBS 123669 / FGSC 9596 / NRRL 45880 / 77-13-4) TaxID=660122 RepID=C7ZHP0_FUSV7|nr:uncharacterized protein NECHADRAFT_81206 [Fusarium vanettenii 77-13-4]EEU36525.1 hypothetical protein NECHADRAFT_81206 [Fusarium vanettenii 77-13-4]